MKNFAADDVVADLVLAAADIAAAPCHDSAAADLAAVEVVDSVPAAVDDDAVAVHDRAAAVAVAETLMAVSADFHTVGSVQGTKHFHLLHEVVACQTLVRVHV